MNATHKIAPAEIIKEDFESFNPSLSGNIDPLLKDALRVLTVEGHSTEGHGRFQKRKFPDTNQLDIAQKALGSKRTTEVRDRVYKEISATRDTMHELLNIAFNYKNPRNSLLYNHGEDHLQLDNMETRKPLWGFGQNKSLTIPSSQFEILQALKGAYLGFSMDTAENRDYAVKRFKETLNGEPLRIGTGSCHVGYRSRMRKQGISLERLANELIDPDEISWLYKKHALVKVKEFRENHHPELFPVFIRTKIGPGCCDDATTLGIGLMQSHLGSEFVQRAHLFARNADYVDTFDKITSSPITNGSDEHIGEELNIRYGKLSHKQNALRASDYLSSRLKYRVSPDEIENELPEEVSVQTIRNYLHKKTGSVFDLSPLEFELLPESLASTDEIATSIFFGAKANHPFLNFSNSVRRFEELQAMENSNVQGINYAGKAHEFFLKTGSPVSGLVYGFERTKSEKFYDVILQRTNLMVDKGYLPKPQFN